MAMKRTSWLLLNRWLSSAYHLATQDLRELTELPALLVEADVHGETAAALAHLVFDLEVMLVTLSAYEPAPPGGARWS